MVNHYCMEQLTNYRNTAFVDGKQFRKSMSNSPRFNFSSVKVDIGFVFINDLNPDFDLTTIFSDISDDMTIEGKGTNKLFIPKEKKPKMGYYYQLYHYWYWKFFRGKTTHC